MCGAIIYGERHDIADYNIIYHELSLIINEKEAIITTARRWKPMKKILCQRYEHQSLSGEWLLKESMISSSCVVGDERVAALPSWALSLLINLFLSMATAISEHTSLSLSGRWLLFASRHIIIYLLSSSWDMTSACGRGRDMTWLLINP